jgi:hypothetical protein
MSTYVFRLNELSEAKRSQMLNPVRYGTHFLLTVDGFKRSVEEAFLPKTLLDESIESLGSMVASVVRTWMISRISASRPLPEEHANASVGGCELVSCVTIDLLEVFKSTEHGSHFLSDLANGDSASYSTLIKAWNRVIETL